MAEYVHAWLHPCLASEQQTVQKNTKWQIASRLEKPQRGGESGISVIQTENIMKKKHNTRKQDQFVMERVCVHGGKEREVWPGVDS